MIGSKTSNNASDTTEHAFVVHSVSCKLSLAAIIALGVACTPEQQATEPVSTFTTTNYAPQNRSDVGGLHGAVVQLYCWR